MSTSGQLPKLFECGSRAPARSAFQDVVSLANKELYRELQFARLCVRMLELEAEAAQRTKNIQHRISLKMKAPETSEFIVKQNHNLRPDNLKEVVSKAIVVHTCDPSNVKSACDEEAVEPIKECSVLEPNAGYNKPLRISQCGFGGPHVNERCDGDFTDDPTSSCKRPLSMWSKGSGFLCRNTELFTQNTVRASNNPVAALDRMSIAWLPRYCSWLKWESYKSASFLVQGKYLHADTLWARWLKKCLHELQRTAEWDKTEHHSCSDVFVFMTKTDIQRGVWPVGFIKRKKKLDEIATQE